MKKSKKLLILTGVAICFIFAVSVFFLKQEAKDVVAAYAAETTYERVEAGEFHEVVLGAGFDVLLVGWAEFAVSLETDHPARPTMTNKNGVLYFSVSDTAALNEPVGLNIRVTDIQRIKSVKSTTVHLEDLEVDSLSVLLEDSQSLRIVDCKIEHLQLETAEGLTITSIQNKEKM